jgi:mRNA interferase RelE/StbE
MVPPRGARSGSDSAALATPGPRIHDATARYAEHEHGDAVKLTGSDTYRLRVGDWRVIFTLMEGGLVVLALRVLNRRDAYR